MIYDTKIFSSHNPVTLEIIKQTGENEQLLLRYGYLCFLTCLSTVLYQQNSYFTFAR